MKTTSKKYNDRYYDAISSGYDGLYEEEQLRKLDLIKNELENHVNLKDFINPGYSLLDVGCGSGISTRFFYVKERYGIDPSRKLIKIAEVKDPKGKYAVKKVESMKYKNKFDIVISLTAIQNFDDIEKGLKNIKRCGHRYILTFLKRSSKRKMIESTIIKYFHVIKKLEEDKDMIYFCE